MSLLHRLEEIKREEKANKKELQKLERNFYRKVYEEIEEMRVEAKVLMERGDLDKAGKIMNDVKKIEKSFNQIITDRLRKILLFTIRSDTRSVKNLTPEEEVFYYEVKASVDRFKATVLERAEVVEPPKPPKKEVVEEVKEEKTEEEYVLVRALSTFSFAYVDRNYSVRKEDVLHIPRRAFRILSKNNSMEEIKL